MELIVVIVILAILAAILIPGLLKWIDQAKDKKYELEAREIAQAAEAALTKMYASGSDTIYQMDSGFLTISNTDTLLKETKKLTNADVRSVAAYGKGFDIGIYGTELDWDGIINGFRLTFVASDGAEIHAKNMGASEYYSSTDGWVFIINPIMPPEW